MLDDDALDIPQLDTSETLAPGQTYRLQPILGDSIVSFNLDV